MTYIFDNNGKINLDFLARNYCLRTFWTNTFYEKSWYYYQYKF